MKNFDLSALPEGCVSHVLSLTSPRDACRSALVSPVFRAAAASDTVWEPFLPRDIADLLSRAEDRVEFSSKRELFFRLCDPILIDGGQMSLFLEKSSGRKCFMLSVKQLRITWTCTPCYWRYIRHPDSRFSEVAELLAVCWLEIRGSLDTKMLSPHTKYGAYLVFKVKNHSRGLTCPLQTTEVKLGPRESKNSVCLNPVTWTSHVDALLIEEETEQLTPMVNWPRRREDGWMEVELGEMENEKGEDGEMDMSLTELHSGMWKNGLIVEGIELRPKN